MQVCLRFFLINGDSGAFAKEDTDIAWPKGELHPQIEFAREEVRFLQ